MAYIMILKKEEREFDWSKVHHFIMTNDALTEFAEDNKDTFEINADFIVEQLQRLLDGIVLDAKDFIVTTPEKVFADAVCDFLVDGHDYHDLENTLAYNEDMYDSYGEDISLKGTGFWEYVYYDTSMP